MATWEHSAAEDEGHSPVRIGWKLVVLGATAAGLLSGLRIYLTYNALGADISLADAIASGVMDWWMWIPFAPLVFWLAQRLEPSHARPVRVVVGHLSAGVLASLGQLFLFSAASGLVRAVRFGDGFRVDLRSPMISSLAPGFVTYLGLVVFVWWIAGRRERAAEAPQPPLAFRAGKDHVLLRGAEIDWVAAAGNYLELHVASDMHLVRETMNAIHARLGSDFVRIHRSTLVRRDAIVTIRDRSHGACVVLSDGTRLPVGARFREELAELVP